MIKHDAVRLGRGMGASMVAAGWHRLASAWCSLYGSSQLEQTDSYSHIGPGLFVTIIGIALVVLGVSARRPDRERREHPAPSEMRGRRAGRADEDRPVPHRRGRDGGAAGADAAGGLSGHGRGGLRRRGPCVRLGLHLPRSCNRRRPPARSRVLRHCSASISAPSFPRCRGSEPCRPSNFWDTDSGLPCNPHQSAHGLCRQHAREPPSACCPGIGPAPCTIALLMPVTSAARAGFRLHHVRRHSLRRACMAARPPRSCSTRRAKAVR